MEFRFASGARLAHSRGRLNEEPLPRSVLRLFTGFILCLFAYVTFYGGCEIARRRNGPWEVTFAKETNNVPVLRITERRMGLTNVTIQFTGETAPPKEELRVYTLPNTNSTPFGVTIFQDGTVLPGTLTLDCFGHEIELLPRTMIINRKEVPWVSGTNIVLQPSEKLPPEQRRPPSGYKR